ncbi:MULTISPECIES: MgtC/SapB family protein [unclassified Arcicella]|uniref:MgtC/SapB family protein n=1 Tax=unclassified Arcicella TaxID=2644986 RepID=UPI0028660EE8|nr:MULTISPECIES: MgtC/SapB family protein [unclassified Arcicella]MDR6563089.1 putative Mg2+ transporter-C (MgtC) family protein [Arcicella sp. BE51]MDR6811760.1 putative Mg2+ transporter-C (MgtC) family protein [Arcicella sp. BE140]MDR6823285.1 putative Mg2+ transporter-C (MgtC) family protein [Arcicella sp. BE139]
MDDIEILFQHIFYNDDFIKILASTGVGALIGLEREYRSKSAGLRTFTLISVGCTIYTILSEKMGVNTSPDRIAANVVTGIGFLGAGVIFKMDDRVKGLTTATIIWVTASLGMAIGDGHILLSFLGTSVVYVVLGLFVKLEVIMERYGRTHAYRIICDYTPDAFIKLEAIFEDCDLIAKREKQIIRNNILVSNWSVRGRSTKHAKLVKRLMADASIKELEF